MTATGIAIASHMDVIGIVIASHFATGIAIGSRLPHVSGTVTALLIRNASVTATVSLVAVGGAEVPVQASTCRSATAAGVGPDMAMTMTTVIKAFTPTPPVTSEWDSAAAAPAAVPVGNGDGVNLLKQTLGRDRCCDRALFMPVAARKSGQANC